MSKSCQEAIELMNLYLDGRLSGGQYQELARHLESCEHCSKRMKYLRVLSSEIRADRPAFPDDLHSSIMEHIARANAPAPERKFSFERWKKPLAVCAAVLILIIAAPFALKEGSRLLQNMDFPGNGEVSDNANSGTGNADQSHGDGAGAGAADPGQNEPVGGDKSQVAYTVPALRTNERFAGYIVATGTVPDLSAYFDLRNVAVYPEDGSIYVYMPNNSSALSEIYVGIRNMGLTLQLNLKGLPETDPHAPEILFLIFPK